MVDLAIASTFVRELTEEQFGGRRAERFGGGSREPFGERRQAQFREGRRPGDHIEAPARASGRRGVGRRGLVGHILSRLGPARG